MYRKFAEKLRKLNTSQIIALGFAILIITGGLILWTPLCAAPGQQTSFSDAMFTATTSVCVTGLVTVPTASHWNLFGKLVILVLIQAGGIGVVSLASLLFIYMRRKISLRNRKMIRESYNVDQMEGLVRLVKRVAMCIFGAEALGAVGYSFRFIPQFGAVQGIWQSVFTAVSAFCNAGIDILGENSLASYVKDPIVNTVTILLIIASGLGFPVWWDLADKVKKVWQGRLRPSRVFRSLRLQSKLVLTTTVILLLGGTVLIFLFEESNPHTMAGMSFGQKLMASLFQSVTTRTAGFATIDQAHFSTAAVALCLVLMFIGGSPMGTAGGVKTTTIAVLFLSMLSNLKGKRDVEFGNRRIRSQYIRSAVVVVGVGFMTLMVSTILLAAVMPQAAFEDILYETTSAVATVGLSRGLTGSLPFAGKWILILTMYMGRIGPLTLGMAVLLRAEKHSENAHLAEEDIMIG
jgi:trk system potassium uptake protein TrkH